MTGTRAATRPPFWYLPPPLAEADVRALVRDAIAPGAGNVDAVMGRIMPQIQGRFEGREANHIVRGGAGVAADPFAASWV